jgi:Zn-dependent protease with chaperone function
MTEVMPYRLRDISPKAYEHPADRAATAALQSIPMLDAVVRRLIEFQYERAFRQMLLGSSVKLGTDQMPELWASYERLVATLDMPATYDLYLTQFPIPNAAAIGAREPMILINSETLALLDADEIRAALAHELGHILSDHQLYRTALMILLQIGTPRLPWMAGLPVRAIMAALLEWNRASELTCDRAAALATRDPLLCCRVMMVLASGTRSEHLNLEPFLKQANEYETWDSGWDRMRRLFTEMRLTHSLPVRRCSELMRWVRGGDYDVIIGGTYPKRSERTDPRDAASDAVDHYRDRFAKIFKEAGEEISSATDRFGDWLKRTDPESRD